MVVESTVFTYVISHSWQQDEVEKSEMLNISEIHRRNPKPQLIENVLFIVVINLLRGLLTLNTPSNSQKVVIRNCWPLSHPFLEVGDEHPRSLIHRRRSPTFWLQYLQYLHWWTSETNLLNIHKDNYTLCGKVMPNCMSRLNGDPIWYLTLAKTEVMFQHYQLLILPILHVLVGRFKTKTKLT